MPKGIYPRKPRPPKPMCAVEGCESTIHGARPWCIKHFRRWQATGDPLKTTGTPHGLTPMERFMRSVEVDPATGCWMWTGASRDGRYGAFSPEGHWASLTSAHIWAYEQTVGPVPEGLELDHFRCSRTMCANPEHVRPVTPRENSLRSNSPAALNRAKTHCIHGHEFTAQNTREMPDGERRCKICEADRQRRYRGRRRLQASQ